MRLWATISVLALLLVGGFVLYQMDPVRSLFAPSSRSEDPLAFLEDDREILTPRKKPEKPRPSVARPAQPRPAAQATVRTRVVPQAPPSQPPDVPNPQVSRVLLGVLKAEGLAYGLSLAVTDQQVDVAGEVDSEEKRRRIIEILNKGRGKRALKADQLVVRLPDQ